MFQHSCRWIQLSVLVFACACNVEPYPYEIPDDQKETYQLRCDEYCRAEAECLAVPGDSKCDTICASYKKKGAFQANYLDTRVGCVESLPAQCEQQDLDDCRDSSMDLCKPAENLEPLLETWCGRWLECNDAPVDRYLQRCLDDVKTNPDSIILSCMSGPAVDSFETCVQDADCQDVINLPLLTLCSGVYQ